MRAGSASNALQNETAQSTLEFPTHVTIELPESTGQQGTFQMETYSFAAALWDYRTVERGQLRDKAEAVSMRACDFDFPAVLHGHQLEISLKEDLEGEPYLWPRE